ncbi:hypothetical protein [Caballeronia sp. LZ016]|uniref:hypothetical protein n=1 Tax=Caballeronia sp. LZ016 TaxID=3038554 RepID=UPI002864FE94|nr:hypothetical protein [Caballeronia sp. LZ016]MDR5740076.1 hypothetical protein [Caballeronia sp. LZ016]
MTSEEEFEFFKSLDEALREDDGAAAREHLEAGFPIYVQTDETPSDIVEKRYPDGRVEFVTFDQYGEHLVSRASG